MEVLSILIIGIIISIIFCSSKHQCPLKRKKPPGPWSLSILGHAPFLGSFPLTTLLKWKRRFGPIYYLKFGTFRTIVLSEAKCIREALANPILCGRPNLAPYPNASLRRGIVMANYANSREQRQFVTKNFKDFGLRGSELEAKINSEISVLTKNLETRAGEPLQICGMFQDFVLNSIFSCVFSHRFEPDDPRLRELTAAMEGVTQLPSALNSLGVFVPWLGRTFPNFTGTARQEKSTKKFYAYILEWLMERKRTRIPDQPRDISDAFMDEQERCIVPESSFHPTQEFEQYTIGDIILVASDTLTATFEWTILLLARFDSVQNALYEEISRITTEFLEEPSLRHRIHMPYTEAVIQEILRFSSVTPIGVPQMAEEDTVFLDYFIAKETMILQNIYGTHHDPDIWGDPENFRPDRFLDDSGNFKRGWHLVAFGAGKRVCLGEQLARDQLFLFTVRFFKKFRVRFPQGRCTRGSHFKFAFVLHPKPFQVVFEHRF